jgi:outer membrane receptor protein involved in Fe transport
VRGLYVRGGDPEETACQIDGVTSRDERTNKPYTTVSLSAIQEVQVQTGGFSAEYGWLRSGVIKVITREGRKDRYSGTVVMRYSPPAPKQFGPSVYDPDTYWNRPYLDPAVCWTGTQNGEPWIDADSDGEVDPGEFKDYDGDGERTVWDEYTQKQYFGFDGWNEISARTLKDEDPYNDLTPEAAQRVYMWQHRRQGDIKEPDYVIDMGFGGPVPFIGKALGDLRFFLSHRESNEMYMVPLATDGVTEEVTDIKITADLSPTAKWTTTLRYGEVHGTNDNNVGLAGYFTTPEEIADELGLRSYITAIMYATDYWCPTSEYRSSFSTSLVKTISARTYFNVGLELLRTTYDTNPNALRDTSRVIKIGNSYWLDESPYGYMPYPSSGIDGLRMGVGMSNSRDSSKVTSFVGRFDYVSQINPSNEVKLGTEVILTKHDVRYRAVELTLPSGRPINEWQRSPLRASIYAQDKLEFEGLIANLGLRMDYTDPSGEWYDWGRDGIDPYDADFYGRNWSPSAEDTIAMVPTKKRIYVSPRLGISHPISEYSKLYFNYVHLLSLPEGRRLYNVRRVTENSVSRIADPNQDASQTVAYELGFERNFFNQLLLIVSAYYKDVSDQPGWVEYNSAKGDVSYDISRDNYYQDHRGLEISLHKPQGKWLTGFMNYTYMVSTSGYFGKQEYYQNPSEQRKADERNEYQSKPIPRPYFRANIALHMPVDFGPRLLGLSPLGGWNFVFLADWREGEWFTWDRGGVPGIRYNIQRPDYRNVDLRLSKTFQFGSQKFQLFVDVNNVFNMKNFTRYPFSEAADRTAYMESLLWPEDIGGPLGFTVFGDDKYGDLRPDDVAYDALETLILNADNDPLLEAENLAIEERNDERIRTKSYIDNPNLDYLYYLHPRDIHIGIRIDF